MKKLLLLAAFGLSACNQCQFQNAEGNCMTEQAYIQMVAHDAVINALADLRAECSSPSADSNPDCALFRRQ